MLSGGRFALGLGTGAFWDAIEAMGGTRLTPGGDAFGPNLARLRTIKQEWDPDSVFNANFPIQSADF